MKHFILSICTFCLLLSVNTYVSAVDNAPTAKMTPAYEIITFSDLDSFYANIGDYAIPDNFLMPDRFSPIGSFHSISSEADPNFGAYGTFYYYMINLHGSDSKLIIDIAHIEPYELPEEWHTLDISNVTVNMAQLDPSLFSTSSPSTPYYYVIYRDGITYMYHGENLKYIVVQFDNMEVTLGPADSSFNNPSVYAEGSFMNALLSLDEEKFAYARDILLSLGEESDKNPSTGDPAVAPIALCFTGMALACLGLTATVALKKRKHT